jgi:peptidoglycan hydrolase CwlO-like protein
MIDKRLVAMLVVALMVGWLAGTLSAPYNPMVASQFQTTPVLSSLTSRVTSLEGQVQSLSSQLASTTSQLKAIASQLDSLQTQVDG